MRLLLLALASSLTLPAAAQPAHPAPSAPAGHRLLFAPTARAIPAGQWRVGVTSLVIPTAGVGLGKGASLGVGVIAPPVPTTGGSVIVEPKWTVLDRPGLALAVGMTGTVNPRADGTAYGVPYAVATVGAASEPGRVSATLGVGARVDVRPTYSEEWTFDEASGEGRYAIERRTVRLANGPAAFAGLEVRATRRVSLLLEAGALPERDRTGERVDWGWCATGLTPEDLQAREPSRAARYDLTGGAALRYATSRVAVDLGAAVIEAHDVYAPGEVGPWVNVAVGLGR